MSNGHGFAAGFLRRGAILRGEKLSGDAHILMKRRRMLLHQIGLVGFQSKASQRELLCGDVPHAIHFALNAVGPINDCVAFDGGVRNGFQQSHADKRRREPRREQDCFFDGTVAEFFQPDGRLA